MILRARLNTPRVSLPQAKHLLDFSYLRMKKQSRSSQGRVVQHVGSQNVCLLFERTLLTEIMTTFCFDRILRSRSNNGHS